MKKILSSILLLFIISGQVAAQSEYRCLQLINGKQNPSSHLLVKNVDFQLNIDHDSQTASINGKMVARNGSDRYDNESMSLFSYFNGEKDFELNGQELLLESYDTSVVCGEATAPCRIWEKLKFNQKTLIGSYEKSYSYSRFFGETINYISIGFQCKK